MKQWVCDRCAKVLVYETELISLHQNRFENPNDGAYRTSDKESFWSCDLCISCFQDFGIFLRNQNLVEPRKP
jgi:hypothetical protein